jgi:threonylcarbamoyladenosine tRNA methylthiotransferase MtaB
VITGVNIGTYAYQGKGLLDVLRMLEDINGVRRIRITSIEPMTLPEGILDYLASSKKLCRFFHIPLQSGDNSILQSMNRRYTREEFSTCIRSFAEAIPEVNIGTDIIVGFPGEGEREFEHSRQLLENCVVLCHVSAFSRKGPRRLQCRTGPSETIKQRSQFSAHFKVQATTVLATYVQNRVCAFRTTGERLNTATR